MGMTKEDTGKVIADRKLRLEEKHVPASTGFLEEEGFSCTILFDATSGTCSKRRRPLSPINEAHFKIARRKKGTIQHHSFRIHTQRTA
jgi:hypothetical protein